MFCVVFIEKHLSSLLPLGPGMSSWVTLWHTHISQWKQAEIKKKLKYWILIPQLSKNSSIKVNKTESVCFKMQVHPKQEYFKMISQADLS